MELGMIGLGRMGLNMAQRLLRAGHRVVGYDTSADVREKANTLGIDCISAIDGFASALRTPRAIWMMVPAGKAVDKVLDALVPHLATDDIIIDGGNSLYKDSQRRARMLATYRMHYVDVGVSGGVWGLENGYSLMIGGETRAVERLRALFTSLAPAADGGWGHVGPSGAGHFVKMIHNGVEYGLMQAYAEGFALMERKSDLHLDLHQIAEIWRTGSVVRSWLLDLTARALAGNAKLDGIAPYVADSGEGRWTTFEAIDLDVPAPVITLSLLERLRSRQTDSFSDKLLAALRQQFGGHDIRKSSSG